VIKAHKDKNFIFTIIFLIVFSNLGSFISIFNDAEIGIQDKNEFPYIDHGCQFSKLEVAKKVHELNKFYESQIEYNFYEVPTNNFYCQDRPVESNGNSLSISENSELEVAIGIGVYTDIDNFERLGHFLLLFTLLNLILSKFKIVNNDNKRLFKLEIKLSLYMLCILVLQSLIVFSSIKGALSNFLISMIVGNYLFFVISKFFNFQNNAKTIIALSVFPLFFFLSNTTFFWITILFCLKNMKNFSIKLPKTYYLISLIFITNIFLNLDNFNFIKKKNLFEWVVFIDKRHRGGIANYQDGFQSILIGLDILILVFLFTILIKSYYKDNGSLIGLMNSMVFGFIIWIVLFLISQIHSITNYFVIKVLGLSDGIDTIFTPQPDGLNWRGLTPSHELTGFWFCVILSMCCFIFVDSKNKKYLISIALVLIALTFNSQRTPLILYFFIICYLIIKYNSKRVSELTSVMLLSLIILLSFPYGLDRLFERIGSINYSNNNFEYIKLKITESNQRYEDYNVDYLNKPSYQFEGLNSLNEFYEIELNTQNPALIKSFQYSAKTFGREIQWIRFLYFNDIENSNFIFGKGVGQSYEMLDVLIEKPHSLYFSVLYQYGLIGVLSLLALGLLTFVKFIASKFEFQYLIIFLFLVNGIKNEFIFTHNQIVFFIVTILMVFNKIENR